MHHTKHFIQIISFEPHNNPVELVLFAFSPDYAGSSLPWDTCLRWQVGPDIQLELFTKPWPKAVFSRKKGGFILKCPKIPSGCQTLGPQSPFIQREQPFLILRHFMACYGSVVSLTCVAEPGLNSGSLHENSMLSHYTNASWRNKFPGVQLLSHRVDTLKMLSFFQKHFTLFPFHQQFLRISVPSRPRKSWISQFLLISVRFLLSQCKMLPDTATFFPTVVFLLKLR